MNRVHIIKTHSYQVGEDVNQAIEMLGSVEFRGPTGKVDTQHISLWPVHGDIYVVIPYEVKEEQ